MSKQVLQESWYLIDNNFITFPCLVYIYCIVRDVRRSVAPRRIMLFVVLTGAASVIRNRAPGAPGKEQTLFLLFSVSILHLEWHQCN